MLENIIFLKFFNRFFLQLKYLINSKTPQKQAIFVGKAFKPSGVAPTVTFKQEKFDLSKEESNLINLISLGISKSSTEYISSLRVRNLDGMSGQSFRHFLNSIVTATTMGKYLEIGVWGGSTAISALWGNEKSAILVDNWSQFGGPKEKAIQRLSKFIGLERVNIVEANFEEFSKSKPTDEIGVYFYDGGHTYEEQKLAIEFTNNLKFTNLICIIDDFNWTEVQNGTYAGIKNIQSELVATWTISPGKKDKLFKYGNWHNGYFVCVLTRD